MFDVETVGNPESVVPDLDLQHGLVARGACVDVTDGRIPTRATRTLEAGRTVVAAGRLGIERMLDCVLEEFGHGHGERRRHIGRHVTQVAVHRDHDGL